MSVIAQRYPAVVIHGFADARAVLSVGAPVTLLSAEAAALYAGSGWWRTLIAQATAGYPDATCDDILDCADASGLALGALRIGLQRIVLHPSAPGWHRVAVTAASLGGLVLAERPPALDMAQPGAARRVHDWLRVRTTPRDSDNALG
jgi:hypothetical protein